MNPEIIADFSLILGIFVGQYTKKNKNYLMAVANAASVLSRMTFIVSGKSFA